MNKIILTLSLIITISCLSTCKKSVPQTDTCHKHKVSFKFGIMVANGTGKWYVTPNVTVGAKPSYLLPTSNGKIVFTDTVNTFYGCDCQSNNISGTNIGVLPADNNVLSNLLYDSDTTGVNIPPIHFTAYVILGADMVIKQQLVYPDPIYVHAIVSLDGCLTKL